MKIYQKMSIISVLLTAAVLTGCQQNAKTTQSTAKTTPNPENQTQTRQTQLSNAQQNQQISQKAKEQQDKQDLEVQLQKSSLVVHGMGCPLCAHNVRKKLYELEPIKDIQPDLSTGNVVIYYEKGTRPTDQQLKKAIDESGFTLKQIID